LRTLGTAAGLVLTLVAAAASPAGKAPPTVRMLTLSGPKGDEPMREPNVAVDPTNPDRIVVTAPSRTPKSATAYHWSTRDGGRDWSRGSLRPLHPGFDIASDPAIAFGPDCRVYYGHLDFGDFARARKLEDGRWLKEGGLGVQRSEDCGRTFTPMRVADNPSASRQADKDWVAVDAWPGSRFRGSVYVMFSFIGSLVDRRDEATDVWFVFSRDGKSFSAPRRLSPNGYVVANAVRPDGTLDAIWEERRWDSQKIWHVSSSDGGETFSAPRLVVALEGGAALDWPVLTATAKGTLVAAWCRRSDRSPAGRYESRIDTAVFENGAWSSPRELVPELAAGEWMSTPALAATDHSVWLLAYGADARETRVSLHRAPLETMRFADRLVLGRRNFGTASFCPGWLDCFDQKEEPGAKKRAEEQFSPGDYVGLSGAGRRVAAAYVLPRDDGPRVTKRPTLYVTIVDE
jgi:hypothetical protein